MFIFCFSFSCILSTDNGGDISTCTITNTCSFVVVSLPFHSSLIVVYFKNSGDTTSLYCLVVVYIGGVHLYLDKYSYDRCAYMYNMKWVLGGSKKLMTVLNIGNYPYHRIENGNGDCIKETKTYQRQTVMLCLPSFITDTLLYNVSEFSMAFISLVYIIV
jgi:hypothetical protein